MMRRRVKKKKKQELEQLKRAELQDNWLDVLRNRPIWHEIYFIKHHRYDTHCLLLLPRLHGRFVFLELVTPVGVNFLIVIAFVRWRTSGVRKEIQLFLLQFSNAFGSNWRVMRNGEVEDAFTCHKSSPTATREYCGRTANFHISSLAYDVPFPYLWASTVML